MLYVLFPYIQASRDILIYLFLTIHQGELEPCYTHLLTEWDDDMARLTRVESL
jgi:hypothetical protein